MKTHYQCPRPDSAQIPAPGRFETYRVNILNRILLFLLAALAALEAASGLRAQSLQIQLVPPNVVISWGGTNAILESAYYVNGPWAFAASGAGPFSTVPMASEQFFRLVSLPAGTNPPPIALDQYYSIEHDTFLNTAPPGVLAGDTATDSNVLTASLYADPVNGSVTLSSDGSFLYIPNPGFVGTDTFQYIALDNLLASAVATVSIMVTDTPPVVVNDQFGVLANTTGGSAAPGVLRNATYLPGDVLTVNLLTTTTNGVLALHSDGSFEYTPNAGFIGDDYFTYDASVGASTSGVAVVTLTVHGAGQPPAAYPTNYTMAHDQTLMIGAPGLLAETYDASQDPLTAALVTSPANGTVSVMPDGSFTYEPTNGFVGADSFTWEASDGSTNSAPATVTITVTNGVPVAVADTYQVNPGGAYTNLAPGVLGNDTDPDGDSLTAVLMTATASGTLTLSTNGGFVYQPNPGFTGTDTFTYAASDGISTSAPVVVTLNVTNRPPVAQPDNYDLVMGETLAVTPPGVLGNDSDLGGNALIPPAAILLSGPANGALTFDTNGGFSYIPVTGFSGVDSFTYAAADAYATSAPVTVTLTIHTNDLPPMAVPDEYTMQPNSTLSPDVFTGVLVNDRDIENCYLTAVLVTGPANGTMSLNSDGTFTYTPAPGFMGTDTFTYAAYNGVTNSIPVPVTITVTDAPPVSVSDSYTVHSTNVLTVYAPGILENDYDPNDGDNLTAVLVAGPRHGTLSLDPSGEFTYQATNGFLGGDTFTYQATDGVVTGAVTEVFIDVQNQAPVAGDDQESTTVNTPLAMAAPGVLEFCEDADGDPLTAVLVSGPANAAAFALNADGSYTYTPAPGFTGTDTFTYAANDGITNSPPATVTITVASLSLLARIHALAGAPAQELDLQAVSFLAGTPVASDTVRPLIGGPPQWLDNGDGIINANLGERSWPYSYVRGNFVYTRVALHTPNRNAFRGANGQYLPQLNVRALVTANGAVVPGQTLNRIGTLAMVPDRIGAGGTLYATLKSSVPIGGAANVLNVGLTWQFTVNGAAWNRCAPPGTPAIAAAGKSYHRLYVTLGLPLTWPLFETEVAVGCVNGAGQTLPNVMLGRIWNEFRNQRATRVDGTPMTYYNNWNVPTLGGVPDLLRFHDGRCGQWASFFIGCLQAQGMAPFNLHSSGVYTINLLNPFNPFPCRGVNLPFLVKNWNFGFPGIATPIYGAGVNVFPNPLRGVDAFFPYENIPVQNNFDQFPPFNATPLPPNGRWGFQWLVPPAVNYVGGNGANKGQNNPLPRSMFTDHAIVFYAGRYFDPSYGTIYQNPQDMQNQAISGISYVNYQQDIWDVSGVGAGPFLFLPLYPVLHIMPTAGMPAMIYICNL